METQDALECCANAIWLASGGMLYDRRYIRGYSPSEYPYMKRARTVKGFTLTDSATGMAIYTAEEFLSALNEDEDPPIDIGDLL